MKILVNCRAFDNMAGGVERMAIAMMGALCERSHDVILLTWDKEDARPFYAMDPRITWHKLNLGNPDEKAGWELRLRRALRVRKIVASIRPDVMIGFQHGAFLALRLFTLGLGIPTIAAERNAPTRFEFSSEGKRRHIIFLTFLLASRITIQCENYRNQYPSYLRSKITTISNPVFPARCQATPAGIEGQKKTMLSVGRISYQKNFDVLIDAFSRICTEFPDWHLLIAGDGEGRHELNEKIIQRGLESKITLAGAVSDVELHYCSSHAFCLPSRWEGFPNALAEAMAHGLPVIGFRECAGVNDLIQHQKNGILADGNGNVDTLTASLREIMQNAEARILMGQAGSNAMKNYAPKKIFDLWETLFRNVVSS
ncbi:MAG: glycosyltransferase family 4 protein [Micavibrio sp.]